MIQNSSFQKKVIYGVMIAVLLVPVSMISRPATRQGNTISGGGTLAQMRAKYNLSQAELGDIDPASETMKLATIGLRGIAVNRLWGIATKQHREQNWDGLAATLNQISKLQPNFLSVWQFQGWNLSYNVSVEFDDYKSRYHWVKRGIDFLVKGVEHNRKEPVLYWELGWFFGHKLGKADEYVQYRRLFRVDEDFHNRQADYITLENAIWQDIRPDNWLVGREWFREGQGIVDEGIPIRGRLVDDTGRIKRGKTPLMFHSHPPKWLMSYAAAIEEEGRIGDVSRDAWRRASKFWNKYGNREIPTTHGFYIRLNAVRDSYYDPEKDGPIENDTTLNAELEDMYKKLDSLVSGVRDRIKDEKLAALTPEEKLAYETPEAERTDEQWQICYKVKEKLEVGPLEIAKQAPKDVRRRALSLAKEMNTVNAKLRTTENYREQVNYEYWKVRCQLESEKDAKDARTAIFAADEAYEQANLVEMRKNYEIAWEKWGRIFEKYPWMVESPDGEDVYDAIMRYKWVIEQMDETFPPKGFQLEKVIEYHDIDYKPSLDDDADVEGDSGTAQREESSTDTTDTENADAGTAIEQNTETTEDKNPDDAESTADADATREKKEDANGLGLEIPE